MEFDRAVYGLEQTTVPKCGIPRHEVHYWVGENANKVFNYLFFFLFFVIERKFIQTVATQYYLLIFLV